MACPQVKGGGAASYMEGSCEYIESVCASSVVKNCYATRTHGKVEPSQYKGKIRCCYPITITTIYTKDTINICRHKKTRNVKIQSTGTTQYSADTKGK